MHDERCTIADCDIACTVLSSGGILSSVVIGDGAAIHGERSFGTRDGHCTDVRS